MATALFTIVGNIIIPGGGGAILGAVVGSLIDNKILFKQKSAPREVFIPETQSAAEGGPAIYVLGQNCRVRGQVIWMSEIRLVQNQQVASVAISVARNEIDSIRNVFAEGFDIYNGSGSASVTERNNFSIVNYAYVANGTTQFYITYLSSLSLAALGPFRRGVKDSVTMQGWSDAGNNWGFGGGQAGNNKGYFETLVAKGARSPTNRAIGRRRDSITAPLTNVNEAVSNSAITVSQTYPPLNPEFASAYELHTGAAAQVKSTIILADEIEIDTPAYEETAYYVLENLRLEQFGLRLPELVAIVSQSSTPKSLPDGIDDLMAFGGWDLDDRLQWDSSGLNSSFVIHGYVMQGNTSIAKRIEILQIAYDFWAQVRDGVLYFFHTEDARVFTVPEEAFGTEIEGGDEPPGLQFSRRAEQQLPSAVTVHYVDLQTFEDASVHENRTSSLVGSPDELVIDMREMTFAEHEAKEIAGRMLWRPHREGEDVIGTLPPSYYYILENDLIETTFNGRTIQVLCTRVAASADGHIQIEGFVYEPDPPGLR